MRKTFVIGFMGMLLVGGFLTGLYLINRPTNPPTSAQENVIPVVPPNEVSVVPSDEIGATGSATLVRCEPQYGKSSYKPGFDPVCDLDSNGLINVLDLQKMK
jgi:hypothetical protein